ncbi:MAG: DUF6777 domain-containing protein [Actinomycetota bacterium]
MSSSWPTPSSPHAAPPGGSRKRIALVTLVLLLVAVLAAMIAYFLASRDSTETVEQAAWVSSTPAPPPPVFEPRGAEGDDAFFPLEAQLAAFADDRGSDAEPMQMDDAAVQTGLFGGTAENTCDPERLIQYLYDNPDKGEAWAQVQGIEFNEIASYIRSLEVRVLAEPTTVLNHGFDPQSGAAYEFVATLDAGTAVLADTSGQVRARCYCGNPIKPVPPVHRPPRCLILTDFVFVAPGGTRRDGAPAEVEATGQIATLDGGDWTEIMWGSSEIERGWTQPTNLRPSYCPTPIDDGAPCADFGTPIYRDPAGPDVIGTLGGEVRTSTSSRAVAARVSRAGTGSGLLIDADRVLIDFVNPAPSGRNSAWVDVAALRSPSCAPVEVCVSTDGPVRARPGGDVVRGGGTYLVAFTGFFAGSPTSAAEVRFVDGGGTGWIDNAYTPQPESRCQRPPGRPECVAGDEAVWPSPTADAADQVIGTVSRAVVSVLDPTPSNERVQIQMGPGGPTGWIYQGAFGSPSYCAPRYVCTDLNAPVFPAVPPSGTPIASPPAFFVEVAVYAIITGPIGGDVGYFSIGIDGQRGWIRTDGLGEFHSDSRCRDGGDGGGGEEDDRPDVCSGEERAFVHTTATSGDDDVVARVTNARLSVVDPAPINGRIHVQVGPGGPVGWIDEEGTERFGGQCRPGPTLCITASAGRTAPDGGTEQELPERTSAARPWGIEAVATPGPFSTLTASTLYEVDDLDDRALWFSAGDHFTGPYSDDDGCYALLDFGVLVCSGGNAVFTNPDANDAERFAELQDAQVTQLTAEVVNGFHQVALWAGGPTGWVTSTSLSPDLSDCAREPACISYELPAYSGPDRSSPVIAEDQLPELAVDTGIRIFATVGSRGNAADLRYFFSSDTPRRVFAGVGSVVEGPSCEDDEPAPPPPPTPVPQPTPRPTPTPGCPDRDGDSVCDVDDNCRDVANPDQADIDSDDLGDACDTCTDVDGDLHCAETDDTCPDDWDPGLADSDRDGIGDVCDTCPNNPAVTNGPCPPAITGCSPGSYLGLVQSVATAAADLNGCNYRIVRIDGQQFNVTFDFIFDRMNWEIDNGVITNITLG